MVKNIYLITNTKVVKTFTKLSKSASNYSLIKESLVECGIQGGSGTKTKTITKILATREVNIWKISMEILMFGPILGLIKISIHSKRSVIPN